MQRKVVGVVIATDEPFCILTAKWVAEQGRKKLFKGSQQGAKGGRPRETPAPCPNLASLSLSPSSLIEDSGVTAKCKL